MRFSISFSEPVVDNNILREIPSGLTELVIPSDVKVIYGSTSSIYALEPSRTTLRSFSFENPSFLTEIQKYSFYQCTALESADFSECINLKSIGDYCFSECNQLKTIKLPFGKLQSIGERAFYKSGITSLIIPNSVTYLGSELCYLCSSLSNFTFQKGSNITTLPISMIRECTKITEVTIPSHMIFTQNTFSYCYGMLNYYLEDNTHDSYIEIDGVIFTKDMVYIIYYPAGRKGDYLIPNQTIQVANYAFSGSTLTVLNFSESVKVINSYTFSKSTIEVFNLPSGLTQIGSSAFADCTRLKSIILPESIKEIGQNAFQSCTGLDAIRLPSNLTSVGGGIFIGCKSTLNITFAPESTYHAVDQMICDKDNTQIIMYLGTNTTITIKQTFQHIKTSAFQRNTYLTHVYFETNSSLIWIYPSAFSECSELQYIEFPERLIKIYESAFSMCSKLKSITIPSSCTIIGASSFIRCTSLENVTIHDHEEAYNISGNAFAHCIKLSNVSIGDNLDIIDNQCFYNCSSLKTIEIPCTCKSLNYKAFALSGLENFTAENSHIETIEDYCFYKCLFLSTVDLPETVKEFGPYAFSETAISNVTIPSSVTIIGEHCFSSCHSLSSFTIPGDSQLETIDYAVFSDCPEFEHITSHSNSFDIINEALYNKNHTIFYVLPPKSPVKFLSFPDELETIQTSALLGCTNLQIILIPSDSVKEIKQNAFENCTNLLTINIPECVQSIGAQAFAGCNKLRCGLVIENRNQIFLDELVSKAMLPRRSLSDCTFTCTCVSESNIRFHPCLFAIFLASVYH